MSFRWSLSLLIFFIIVGKTSVFGQQEIKVISWNIRLDTQVDGINAWEFRKEALVNQIIDIQPDLFGLQEVLHNQLEYISSQLPEYEYLGVGRTDGKEAGEYAPVFFKKSRFERINDGNFWLSEQSNVPGAKGWDAAYERIVSWVQLFDRNTLDTIWFFNTHFDHIGKLAQKQSAELIKEKINSQTQSQFCILTGDFNVSTDELPYQILTDKDNGFQDARMNLEAGQALRKQITFTGFDQDPENDALIDFIFYTHHASCIWYEVMLVNRSDFYLSDHLPVAAILTTR